MKKWGIGNRKTDLLILLGILTLYARAGAEIVFSPFAQRAAPGLSSQAIGHYEFVAHHLQQPFKGYKSHQVLFNGFSIVALSHMASGLANMTTLDPSKRPAAATLLEEIIRRAISPHVAPLPRFTERSTYWKKEHLYLSHLNLILGTYRVAGGDLRFDALHTQISTYLSEKTLKEPDFTLESYGGGDKWPADQTVTLCSLYVYDRTHGTTLSKKPIAGWLAYMKQHMTNPDLTVHESYFSTEKQLRVPRGCALSWSTLYMAQFAPAEARDLYSHYRKHFFSRWRGWGGFREWPRGQNLGMSVDTGPILFGVGFAASGLGVGPMRLLGDSDAYKTVMRTGALAGCPLEWRGRRFYLFSPLLGEAILFNGETATRWFKENSHEL